jgi:dTDP-4-dehydrorhamnose 3,5-epimerase
MEFIKNLEGIEGPILIIPDVYGDERGFFKETFNEAKFKENGIDIHWMQSNHSRSAKGVLRGLHWQKGEFAQDKLVRVANGAVLDVAVDIRRKSPTYGKYISVELSDTNHNIFLVPKGFAHGFLALSDLVDFEYMVSAPYNKESERAISWNDPDISIEWGIEQPLVSEKDSLAPEMTEIDPSDLF